MEGEFVLMPGFCFNRVTDFKCIMWILPLPPPPGWDAKAAAAAEAAAAAATGSPDLGLPDWGDYGDFGDIQTNGEYISNILLVHK